MICITDLYLSFPIETIYNQSDMNEFKAQATVAKWNHHLKLISNEKIPLVPVILLFFPNFVYACFNIKSIIVWLYKYHVINCVSAINILICYKLLCLICIITLTYECLSFQLTMWARVYVCVYSLRIIFSSDSSVSFTQRVEAVFSVFLFMSDAVKRKHARAK